MYLCFGSGKVYAIKADPTDEPFREDTGIEGVILDALRKLGKATADDISEYCGKKSDSIKNALTKMVRLKKVQVAGQRGRAFLYVLPGEGD